MTNFQFQLFYQQGGKTSEVFRFQYICDPAKRTGLWQSRHFHFHTKVKMDAALGQLDELQDFTHVSQELHMHANTHSHMGTHTHTHYSF